MNMAEHPCGKCKYFGEPTGEKYSDGSNGEKDFHRCHNEKSIFKACLSTASGCLKYEEKER